MAFVRVMTVLSSQLVSMPGSKLFKPLVSSLVTCRSMSTGFAGTLLPDYKEQQPDRYTTSTYEGTQFTEERNGTQRVFNVHPLSENKRRLKAAFDACDVSQNFRAVMLSVAMQESAHMDVAMRDADKDFRADGTRNPAANATCFNLNVDLINKTGYFGDRPLTDDEFRDLNSGTDESLRKAVGILKLAFEKWGIENTLAFVRGGGSAFDKNKSCWKAYTQGNKELYNDTEDYLNAIRTFLRELDQHPEYFYDGHRPNIECKHI